MSSNNSHLVNRIKLIWATVFCSCLFIYSCENTDEQIKALTSRRIGVEQAKNVVINYGAGGKVKAKLSAPLMLHYQDTVPYFEFTKHIHADFYDSNFVIESRMDARYARYMETENKVFLKDSVKVINTLGDTLYCKELYWDRSKIGHEFYTDKPVRIRTKTQTIDGDGLDSPQDFKDWHIVNPKGLLKVPNSQFPG